jgi:hypothetical protein
VTRDQELDLLGVDLLTATVDEVLDAALDRVAQRDRYSLASPGGLMVHVVRLGSSRAARYSSIGLVVAI